MRYLLILLLLCPVVIIGAETVSINDAGSIEDTEIRSTGIDYNYGGATTLNPWAAQDVLIRVFNLDSLLDPDYIVTACTLQLLFQSHYADGTYTFYRLRKVGWIEGIYNRELTPGEEEGATGRHWDNANEKNWGLVSADSNEASCADNVLDEDGCDYETDNAVTTATLTGPGAYKLDITALTVNGEDSLNLKMFANASCDLVFRTVESAEEGSRPIFIFVYTTGEPEATSPERRRKIILNQ